MRAAVVVSLALAGCDTLFHLDYVPLPGDGSVTPDTVSEGSDTPNLAFVSSQSVVPASLGGAGAADALCTTLARNAGHPGHYVAWLGTSTQSATTRIGGVPRGWVRADGRPFGDTLVDIALGRVWYPLRLTETGDDLALTGNATDLVVVTGTNPDGTSDTNTCGDYTTATIPGVQAGLADNAPSGWNSNMGASCTQPVHLYCFGVDHAVPVSIVPEGTRHAFVTINKLSGGAGLGAFDNLCNSEASGPPLPGTFHAALATTASSALGRFATGGPWIRPDGVTAIDAGGKLLAPIALAADGSVPPIEVAWCGATSPITKAPGNAASCFDWTRSDATQGLSGNDSRSSSEGFGGLPNTCGNAMSVYCLQD
ncbi:MAG: hypothetical protein JO257_25410 [Deltaproteobacteria bacterium]|nr:hypothetical protein [Deltaproteobacteria bacterium]